MSDTATSSSNVNFESEKSYRHILLNQALSEGIRRNEEQFKVWSEYKKRHKKVIEALERLPLELTINCMVPIGKRALMKGKLIHTNEVLACLGDGYFAKYSGAQAIALCNRRIQLADEMLNNLETERNLYEMRQYIPLEYDAFGEDKTADLVEHWDETKLDDWRVEHRRREKEYHEKLSELRKKEKTEIRTEEDLFQRLDELELQEELMAEMDRLEDERKQFYGEELEQGEAYYETDEEGSSDDEHTNEEIERELKKLKEIRMGQNEDEQLSIESKPIDITVNMDKEIPNIKSEETPEEVEKIASIAVSDVSCGNLEKILENESSAIAKSKSMSDINSGEIKVKRQQRRVSLVLPNSSVDNDNNGNVSGKNKVEQCAKITSVDVDDREGDNDTIRIEFQHTDNNPSLPEFTGAAIECPSDIYRMFYKPKSILKRSPNDLMPPQNDIVLPAHSSGEEDENEDEDEDQDQDQDQDQASKPSAYNFVVKDICEKELSVFTKNDEVVQEKRPVSRFKMERSTLKK